MEKILELSDSYDSKYPEHFQIFLDNCVKKYADKFSANDYLFAAVYFLILETGFTPAELASDINSVTFDVRKLRSVQFYNDDNVKITKQKNKSKYICYQLSLILGNHSSSLCELQGVPSAEINPHLIINFLCKEPQIIKSLCLSTDNYTEKNEVPSQHKYVLKNLKELSNLVKNRVSVHVKDIILTYNEEGCNGNLLCLPEEVQKKIIYFLKSDPASIQCLSASCTYFYNFITVDSKLWEEICFQEYGGWDLNRALQETNNAKDNNVFRTAFLNLKAKDYMR